MDCVMQWMPPGLQFHYGASAHEMVKSWSKADQRCWKQNSASTFLSQDTITQCLMATAAMEQERGGVAFRDKVDRWPKNGPPRVIFVHAKTRNPQPACIFFASASRPASAATSPKHSALNVSAVSRADQRRCVSRQSSRSYSASVHRMRAYTAAYSRGLYLHISEIFIKLISQQFSLEMEPGTFKFLWNASLRIKNLH